MNILEHLDKNNLHHAYLIEGERDKIVPKIFEFFESLNIKTFGNPDFCHISIDNFKIEEAFSLRAMSFEKSFSASKKIFVICVNSFSLEAENVLLKMFEEPIKNTHFFLIVPDVNALLKTLISRFYLIKSQAELTSELIEAKKFLALDSRSRIDFIKEFLAETEESDDESNKIMALDSTRSKALKFLNALESIMSKGAFDIRFFEHLFKVREFLRMPGSSIKNLLESVALIVPSFDLK